MLQTDGDAWKCAVCGYVHRGSEPPEECPVCGVSREEFEPHAEEPRSAPGAGARRWRCIVCDYVHEGSQPPEECPVCGAAADQFEPLEEADEAVAAGTVAGRILVVGAGIAGLAAAEALRAASPDAEIGLVSKETELPYYRLNLTRYLAGEIGAEALPVHPQDWYETHRIRLLRGCQVRRIHPEEGTVQLDDGVREPFDKLVLTVGSHPFVPPFPGTRKEGVVCLRTVADAERILEGVRAGARCACIGGGILGLETAGALARKGARVTLLENHGWLLPRQLNREAGERLERHVRHLGIELRHGARTEEIAGDERARAVRLQDGNSVGADLVVIATGVRPNSYLARLAGLPVNRGILVDDYLATSHPDILAAGDVAEHRGVLYGTWMASQSQGRIAGMNAAGLRTEFGGIPRSHTLKVLGLDLFSVGQIEAEDASYETVEQETDDGRYFRFVFRDGCMVGAILLGDATLAARVTGVIEKRADCSALLRQRPAAVDVLAALSGR